MIPEFIDKAKIPHKPGIYIYKDEEGEILYVGKAIDLYSRVSSYFNGAVNSFKTSHMVTLIRDIETIVVESEMEALILEANLIKKYLPPYNIRLTDDKDYLYIAVTREAFPKVITARKKDLTPIKYWFGPFPSSTTVRTTLKQLRRVFPWCSNPPGARNKTDRPCFYYHIKLCPGACVGEISQEDYNKIINQFIKFLDGKKDELTTDLQKEMNELSADQKFEEAARVKKTLSGISYVLQPNKVSNYLQNPNFLEDQNHQALLELQKVLGLPEFPERIEAYDISNISGTNATGSMVVLTNGEIDKSQYRRFKIKITGKPDDYAMHAEMMGRRLKHSEWPYPQLFLIDGGRGQVRASKEAISNFQFLISNEKKESKSQRVKESRDVIARKNDEAISNNETMKQLNNAKIYGIAKRFEWLYPPEGEVIKLPKRSLALRLLQKIRDESHRFAITYHRKLRAKQFGV